MQISKTQKPLKNSIFSQVVSHFKNNDWQYIQLKDATTLQLPIQGKHGEWRCYLHVSEQLNQLRVYAVAPMLIPELQRMAVAEFITRINYDMTAGNFELDLNDGELRYKTSTEIYSETFPASIIAQMVYVNTLVMDEYLPAIMAVSYGKLSPLEAEASLREPIINKVQVAD